MSDKEVLDEIEQQVKKLVALCEQLNPVNWDGRMLSEYVRTFSRESDILIRRARSAQLMLHRYE